MLAKPWADRKGRRESAYYPRTGANLIATTEAGVAMISDSRLKLYYRDLNQK